ncbi:YihY/virulence factor BrkB family protein [Pistricoccus aurantiacus]|uniref:YihY/virulence factor BrkB family protein n=1 Tax=Pistricoccus aurantiacus TaxID=1883414 RepID=UPI0036406109
MVKRDEAGQLVSRLLRFCWRVIGRFFANRGILLAGGVGYNVLLSIVPLFAVLSVTLTHIVAEDRMLEIIDFQARHLAPSHADVIQEAVRALLDSPEKTGLLGILVLFVFSSFAFRMLEDSFAIIFRRLEIPKKRRMWISVLLPYAFIMVLGSGLLGLTVLVSTIDALDTLLDLIFASHFPFANISTWLLSLFSFIGLFLLFSAIYKVLPVAKISMNRALIGGFVAALLWEGVRLILVGYFANISFVNAVYGSLATIIIVLLSLEIGAVILLLGAQVIAELEYNDNHGLPWYAKPTATAPEAA